MRRNQKRPHPLKEGAVGRGAILSTGPRDPSPQTPPASGGGVSLALAPTISHVAGAPAPASDAYHADVIILALVRVRETVDAIRSALAQTGVTRHVTILDQGSMSENLAWLEATVAGRPDATLLRSDRNLVVAEGRN